MLHTKHRNKTSKNLLKHSGRPPKITRIPKSVGQAFFDDQGIAMIGTKHPNPTRKRLLIQANRPTKITPPPKSEGKIIFGG